jgi:hypothetical protein
MFATRAGELAAVIYAQGRYAEADRWTEASENAASKDDLDARLAWQPVRAKLLARRGEHELGQQMARDVAAAAQGTDALNQCARVLLDLGEVLRLAGCEDDAPEFVEQARRRYEEKGNVAGAAQIAAAMPA